MQNKPRTPDTFGKRILSDWELSASNLSQEYKYPSRWHGERPGGNVTGITLSAGLAVRRSSWDRLWGCRKGWREKRLPDAVFACRTKRDSSQARSPKMTCRMQTRESITVGTTPTAPPERSGNMAQIVLFPETTTRCDLPVSSCTDNHSAWKYKTILFSVSWVSS